MALCTLLRKTNRANLTHKLIINISLFLFKFASANQRNNQKLQLSTLNTLFLFYKNILSKNIEPEICEILRIF